MCCSIALFQQPSQSAGFQVTRSLLQLIGNALNLLRCERLHHKPIEIVVDLARTDGTNGVLRLGLNIPAWNYDDRLNEKLKSDGLG